MAPALLQNHPSRDRIDPKALPGNVEECHALILALAGDLKDYQERVDYLSRKMFGRSSEKLAPAQGQLSLFDELQQGEARADEIEGAQEAEPADEPSGAAPARKRRGRKPLPADLPRMRVEHDLSAQDKSCPQCGQTRERIGEDKSEQLEYLPASFHVIEHVRFKYACRHCQGQVVEAPKPAQPIEKSLAGPGLLAHTITSKYCDHLPLHRLEGIFARHGVDISRQTMCEWVMQSAALCEPVVRRMKERLVTGDIVNTDDTPVPCQDPDNKGSTHRAYLWVYIGDANHPFTVYDFSWTREGKWTRDFLDRFEGYLQADAFGGYNAMFEAAPQNVGPAPIVEVGCWAHARRKFHDAIDSDAIRAHQALHWIRELYRVEKLATERKLDAEGRRGLRREKSRAILHTLFEWMQANTAAVLPKSPLGKALGYALGNRAALSRYVEVGELAIDNNSAERALRRIVVGRNNWLFAGSPRGGRAAAILYSLIESARRHGHDPFAYLRDLLARIPTHPHSALSDLLPDRWKPLARQS